MSGNHNNSGVPPAPSKDLVEMWGISLGRQQHIDTLNGVIKDLRNQLIRAQQRADTYEKLYHNLLNKTQKSSPKKRAPASKPKKRAPAGETKTNKKKANPNKKPIIKEINQTMKKITKKSGNTVAFPPISLTDCTMKQAKDYLSKMKKYEKITNAVAEHTKEMKKRGVSTPEYDVGAIINRFPTLKMGEIKNYLKKDLPKKQKKTKKMPPNILKSLRDIQ